MKQHEKDRKEYLDNQKLEKEKAIEKDISNLNESLNKEIELNTIEMEF